MHSLCYGNEFDLNDNKRVGKTHFHNQGCAPGLVLKLAEIRTEPELAEAGLGDSPFFGQRGS